MPSSGVYVFFHCNRKECLHLLDLKTQYKFAVLVQTKDLHIIIYVSISTDATPCYKGTGDVVMPFSLTNKQILHSSNKTPTLAPTKAQLSISCFSLIDVVVSGDQTKVGSSQIRNWMKQCLIMLAPSLSTACVAI